MKKIHREKESAVIIEYKAERMIRLEQKRDDKKKRSKEPAHR